MNMVIELGQKVLAAPWPKIASGQPNPLGGDSAAGGRGDIDGLVQEIDAGGWITEAQPRERKIGADDAALDGVSRQLQRGDRPVEAVVCVARVTRVEGAQAVKSVQAIGVEPSVWIVDGQLLDGLPGPIQGSSRLAGLTSASTDLRVHSVSSGSNGVTRAAVSFDGRGASDRPRRLQIVGRVEGHHGVARLNGGSMASVREVPRRLGRIGVQRQGGLVVTGLEGQTAGERVRGRGEQYQLLPQTDLVKLQEPSAGLDDRRELKLETDERSCTDLPVDRPDRLVQPADDIVVELRGITLDRDDARPRARRQQHEQVAVIASRAVGDQLDELSYSIRRRSEMAKRVQQGVEIGSGANRQVASWSSRVEVRQQELVTVARAGSVGDAFPPGDGALDAGDLPVHQRGDRALACGVPQRSGQVSPGPAAPLAQLAQQERPGLPIGRGHDVQYTIRPRSYRHDQPRFALLGCVVHGVPGAAGRLGASGEANNEAAAVDHPPITGVIGRSAQPVSSQLDDLDEPARFLPTADASGCGGRLVGHHARNHDGQRRLTAVGQPVQRGSVDAGGAAEVEVRVRVGERPEVAIEQAGKLRLGFGGDRAGTGDRHVSSHARLLLRECHRMSSAPVVPGHDLMNAPAAARVAPRPCRSRLPIPTTTTVITMSLLTTMNHLTMKNGWSSAVDDMLHHLVDDGFAFHVCGKRLDPVVLVASYHWKSHVDLLTITEPNHVTAARALREPGFDVFNPGSVIWAYGNEAEPTLRALLDLKHPDHPDHPVAATAPPRLMIVPAQLQRPMTFKAAESWKVGNRARRLEAALASELVAMEAAGPLDEETRGGMHSTPGSAA